ncbi:glutathione S-transferase [Cercophora newfieldiana]|uniref:Glutathione S-transferase n=1 Tax=Cercophora newfieldiana TaxID=92897 RepID=A0AA40CWG6_9PEZI|nr:glutathione S-transferase [Cercophora newfieldiana]
MHRRLTLLASHLIKSKATPQIPHRSFSTMSSSKTPTDIHLYTAQTPNGIKVSMLLEELNLSYKVTELSFSKNEQKEPWFLEINPNGRIPAITDTFTDGKPIRVFESGAILQYLVERYDTEGKFSYPKGGREYWEVQSWLFWQMGGLGPMQGQANHFFRYAPEKIEYGIKRYQGETRRLYSVMETQLAKSTSGFLVGDKMTIADIACWGWTNSHDWAGVSLDDFPNVAAWVEKIKSREASARGANLSKSVRKNLTEEEKEKIAKEASAWILQGNEHTAKK